MATVYATKFGKTETKVKKHKIFTTKNANPKKIAKKLKTKIVDKHAGVNYTKNGWQFVIK